MSSFLRRAIKEKIWADNFDPALRQEIINRFNRALIDHLQQVPLPSNKYAYKLYKRFLKHNKSILLFMSYQDLPSTNNGSERAICNAKIHKKISGCFRNSNAPKRHATILSTIETAKKQGISILYACKSLRIR